MVTMSMRRPQTPKAPNHANARLRAVLTVTAPAVTGTDWRELPPEIKALIVFQRVKDALALADAMIINRFYTQDGPPALRALCDALIDLGNLKLTDKEAYKLAVQKFSDLVDMLRSILGKVAGWKRGNGDDHVYVMCMKLEELLQDVKAKPPPLSRQTGL